jgi:rSAM/selenodomain-associated transferase 2
LPPFVSIIVPVRGDAAVLAALLAQLAASCEDISDVEVIVACANPVDAGLRALQERYAHITWVESAAGRGTQLNAGAGVARGAWLWFVHADSRLPAGWPAALRSLAHIPDEFVGGAFRFALDSSAWQARLLERAVALRVRLFGLPYGDQGLFVRRVVFQRMGGFAPIPLMEDVEFVQRLKRLGRLRHLTLHLTTSARRWEQEGWLRGSARNVLTLGMYAAGVSPERLARRYYGGRGHS